MSNEQFDDLLKDEDAPSILESEVPKEPESKPKKKKAKKQEHKDPLFNGSKWHEYDLYECPACPYRSIERARVEVHVAQRHGPEPEAPPEVSSTLVDRFNNPLKVKE